MEILNSLQNTPGIVKEFIGDRMAFSVSTDRYNDKVYEFSNKDGTIDILTVRSDNEVLFQLAKIYPNGEEFSIGFSREGGIISEDFRIGISKDPRSGKESYDPDYLECSFRRIGQWNTPESELFITTLLSPQGNQRAWVIVREQLTIISEAKLEQQAGVLEHTLRRLKETFSQIPTNDLFTSFNEGQIIRQTLGDEIFNKHFKTTP